MREKGEGCGVKFPENGKYIFSLVLLIGGGSSILREHGSIECLRKACEKIGAERLADSPEQAGVDVRSGENIIYVASVAMDLATQPRHAPLLAAQLIFNNFSDKYRLFFSRCYLHN